MDSIEQFAERVRQAHQNLGIPVDYAETCQLPLCHEPALLVDTEPDHYQRPQKLTPEAFQAWAEMKAQATRDGISLFLISAFRSLEYQCGLIEKKLANGQVIDHILTVNAAPGYSEHHTGRAIDLGTEGCDSLQEEFENTEAFQWLNRYAKEFDFHLSYPKNNPHGITYEPWHWCFSYS